MSEPINIGTSLAPSVKEKLFIEFKGILEILDEEEPFDYAIYEDFDLHGRCGGNYDDAYSLGIEHGRQQLADEIKELLK